MRRDHEQQHSFRGRPNWLLRRARSWTLPSVARANDAAYDANFASTASTARSSCYLHHLRRRTTASFAAVPAIHGTVAASFGATAGVASTTVAALLAALSAVAAVGATAA